MFFLHFFINFLLYGFTTGCGAIAYMSFFYYFTTIKYSFLDFLISFSKYTLLSNIKFKKLIFFRKKEKKIILQVQEKNIYIFQSIVNS